jgi:hypothetical protein
MQRCPFFSKGGHTFRSAGPWCADVQNHSFPTRKTTFSMGHCRAMPFRTVRGLRELARGTPICCTCRFPTMKNTISWPCAPAHVETSAPVSGPAKGAMRNMLVSYWESTHSERHGLHAKASFLKVDAFPLGISKLSMVLRVVVCVLRDVCSAGGGTWGRTRGGHQGRGSLYRRAPPVDRRCPPSCPPKPPA